MKLGSSLSLVALWAIPSWATFLSGNQMALPLPPPILADDVDRKLGRRDTGQTTFQQLIDHSNPSLGTFSQRYWWSTEFYAGPGSPVVFFTPGEIAADGYTGYLTNRTLTGLIAKEIGGAVVLMEHRYWGESSPYQNLSTKNLQYLTLANSIADTVNFARNVNLPFDTDKTNNAPGAPWVMAGGSYSGALSAWVESVAPGTFWAYHASSAVVEAVGDFWQYFEPVMRGMPQNCSADLNLVIEHIDEILTNGTVADKAQLKKDFGFPNVKEDGDFASTLENGPWLWQAHDFSTDSGFFKFCDYIENAVSSTTVPGAEGVGLDKALAGYKKWSNEVLAPTICDGYGYWPTGSQDCINSLDASNLLYKDLTPANAGNRQWNWFLCNEPFKFWQNGAPHDHTTIVSRLVDSAYFEKACPLWFPDEPREDGQGVYTYGIAENKTEQDVNTYTGGWFHTNTTRLVWVNGEFDPWLDSTVSSPFRPGGALQSTSDAPVLMIPGGIHCSDLAVRNARANAGVQKVQTEVISIIKGWVDEFPKKA